MMDGEDESLIIEEDENNDQNENESNSEPVDNFSSGTVGIVGCAAMRSVFKTLIIIR